jgi:hypothetical protein
MLNPIARHFLMPRRSNSARVSCALPVCNRLVGVGGSTVTACVRLDKGIFAHKLVAAGVDPMFLATRTAMKKEERVSRTFSLVIHLDIVELNAFGLHDAHYGCRRVNKQSGKCA